MIYIVALIVILLDQLAKYFVVQNMQLFETIPVINGVFHLTYVQNTGAAFGILQDGNILFIILTSAIIAAILIYKYRMNIKDKFLLCTLGMIIGGAVGNLIDRFIHKAVIDFLDFRLINFAVFNVADCFVVVGCIMLAVLLIFFDETSKKKGNENEGV